MQIKKKYQRVRLPDSLLVVAFGYLATGTVVFFGEIWPIIQPLLGYIEAMLIELAGIFNLFLGWKAEKSRRPDFSDYRPFFRDVGLGYLPVGLIGFLGTQAHGPAVLAIGLTLVFLGFVFLIIGARNSGITLRDWRLLFDSRIYRLP